MSNNDVLMGLEHYFTYCWGPGKGRSGYTIPTLRPEVHNCYLYWAIWVSKITANMSISEYRHPDTSSMSCRIAPNLSGPQKYVKNCPKPVKEPKRPLP